MKNNIKYMVFILFIIVLNSCKTGENTALVTEYQDSIILNNEFSIRIVKGNSFNKPTFVIWAEDMEGNYIKTLFITQSYASGIFGYRMIGDSIWENTPGESLQPAALPYWKYKKGFIDGKYLIPEPGHPFVDAYTGATPKGSFNFKTRNLDETTYRLLVEVNQSWDWNQYWTNSKYEDSNAYKHSAQPSIIYSVTINCSDSLFYLNPIGHGDPKGESGKLFTDLSTLTTAKNIFSSIKVQIKK